MLVGFFHLHIQCPQAINYSNCLYKSNIMYLLGTFVKENRKEIFSTSFTLQILHGHLKSMHSMGRTPFFPTIVTSHQTIPGVFKINYVFSVLIIRNYVLVHHPFSDSLLFQWCKQEKSTLKTLDFINVSSLIKSYCLLVACKGLKSKKYSKSKLKAVSSIQ